LVARQNATGFFFREYNNFKLLIKIWFQNRRARYKRFKPFKNNGQTAVNSISSASDVDIHQSQDSKFFAETSSDVGNIINNFDTGSEQCLGINYLNNSLFEASELTNSPFFSSTFF
jgi:hypothetical protein